MSSIDKWENAPQIEIKFPNGDQPVLLPKGWTRAENTELLTAVSPEGDLRCTFLIVPLAGNAEETSKTAWLQVDSTFDRSIAAQGEVPSTEGWDKISQVVYVTPAAESRNVFSIIRTLGDLAYVILIDGSKASVSRRMAQISEMLELWKPAGLKTVNFAERGASAWGDRESRAIREFIRDGMERCLIPGLAIAIVQNGCIVFAEGFGVRTLGQGEQVTSKTRFMIGSSTKPLTTLMMARMIDQGAFTWSTPVTDLLPDFSLADAEVTRKLQMRHTVCACTGMPRRDVDFVFRYRGVSPEQRLQEMRAMMPTTGFGETFQYSNLLVALGGYAAASRLLPAADLRTAYEEAIKSLIFTPLGMADTFLSIEEASSSEHAHPHAIDFDEECVPIDVGLEGSVESVAPAGGAWSTVEDIAQYLLLELRGGIAATGTRLVREESLRSRWSGGIKINEKMGYGLGLLYSDEQGLKVLSHGGNTFGFTSEMFFLPDQNLGVIVLTNCRVANAFLGALRQRIFELLFGAESKAEEMIVATVKARKDAHARTRERIKTDAISTSWIADWVGQYSSDQLGPATITDRGEGFHVQFESWGSSLGAEVQPTGARLIALTSPPWAGSLRLQTSPDTGDLILDAGQEKYTFKRQF